MSCFGTRKAEVLNSLVMKITANKNDTNDVCIVFTGRDFHYKYLVVIIT